MPKVVKIEACWHCDGTRQYIKEKCYLCFHHQQCCLCDGSGFRHLQDPRKTLKRLGTVKEIYPGVFWPGLNGNIYLMGSKGPPVPFILKLSDKQVKPYIAFLEKLIAHVKRGERKRKRDKR